MDDNHLKFIKRLVHYFKPSSNRFSHQELGHGRHIPSSVIAGVELIDWLLQSNQEVIILSFILIPINKLNQFYFYLFFLGRSDTITL